MGFEFHSPTSEANALTTRQTGTLVRLDQLSNRTACLFGRVRVLSRKFEKLLGLWIDNQKVVEILS